MVKSAQASDLEGRANLVSESIPCHQHQRELVQCHKMCIPDLQSLLIVAEGSLHNENVFHYTQRSTLKYQTTGRNM